MPVINIQIQQLDEESRQRLITDLTETASQATGIPASAFLVFIDEYEMERIGVGGINLRQHKRNQGIDV